MHKCQKISDFLALRKLVRGFTIMELLVAVGLLAVVLAAVGIIFRYSIDAQRTAASTAEMMHTLRAITDQINIDFTGLQKDGYLVLRSDDSNSALYFFSVSQGNFFQSWMNPDVNSNIARIYLGPAGNDPNNLALDMRLLTPGCIPTPGCKLDYNDVSFAQCKADIVANFEDPNAVLSTDRPNINMALDPNNARRILAQHVGSFKIEWTYGWFRTNDPNDRIVWWGLNNVGDANFANETSLTKPNGSVVDSNEIAQIASAIKETKTPAYYRVRWDPTNQQYWPKALKFTFTLYDSRGLFKNGRKFEHIVYIGN